MSKMQSCCIRGCDSYKQTEVKNIGYFKFPLHDIFLLNKWLGQINRTDWAPSEFSQICSAHFKDEDLDLSLNRKHPLLLPNAVPTIFPIQRKAARKRRVREEVAELKNYESKISAAEIGDSVPHRNKVSLLRRKPAVSMPPAAVMPGVAKGSKIINEIQSKLRNILTKPIDVNGAEMVSSSSSSSQKPFLRITINKKLNIPTSSKPVKPFETIYLPCHRENEGVSVLVKVENPASGLQTNPSKSAISNVGKDRYQLSVTQRTGDKSKLKESPADTIPTQYDLKRASRDHVYSCRSAVKARSVDSKGREDSDELKRRLKELRERRKREQLKIVRLQMHLDELEKKMKENNEEKIVVPNLGQRGKSGRVTSCWLLREKEEYEKLLKDVREIKLKVLRERHDRELDKIRRFQIQMGNLRKKMKENNEKEIALANLRETSSPAAVRPDWMKREEEEYEKLLQDVRKMKQSYRSRKQKQDSVKSDNLSKVIKCERVLSDEDCAFIETMQKKSRIIEEIKDGNRLIHKIETGIDPIDYNDEYGEVIGEIDDDSIDIDMSKEATILNFNDELPDPGLLDD